MHRSFMPTSFAQVYTKYVSYQLEIGNLLNSKFMQMSLMIAHLAPMQFKYVSHQLAYLRVQSIADN